MSLFFGLFRLWTIYLNYTLCSQFRKLVVLLCSWKLIQHQKTCVGSSVVTCHFPDHLVPCRPKYPLHECESYPHSPCWPFPILPHQPRSILPPHSLQPRRGAHIVMDAPNPLVVADQVTPRVSTLPTAPVSRAAAPAAKELVVDTAQEAPLPNGKRKRLGQHVLPLARSVRPSGRRSQPASRRRNR
jgi:hypothetical protein